MKTIYILTEGDYSDYHIIGAYSTQKLAEKAQSLYPYSEIEEFDLDNVPDCPPGMKMWQVILDGSGVSSVYSTNPFISKCSTEVREVWNGRYEFICWAVDKEHAEKIALDNYYQHQAQKAGIA